MLPTVIEPLRQSWAYVQGAAVLLAGEGRQKEAVNEIRSFHHRLCSLRVLDPACGSGNFLYVALEHLKRLEGEVLNQLHDLGESQAQLETAGFAVDPHQFLGLEINPRAAAIAELVLWIGYLQWHFRTRGAGLPPQPVLKDFRNIECRDAVLAHNGLDFVMDEQGIPRSRWDGRTLRTHPVTGAPVPDEAARQPLERYRKPRQAAWPEADVVIGNPPFIGAASMRAALGDGYVDALRGVWREMPESADFVMYWWHHAAQLVAQGRLSRFGFITTNSLRQTFNRRVVQAALDCAERASTSSARTEYAPERASTSYSGRTECAPERDSTGRTECAPERDSTGRTECAPERDSTGRTECAPERDSTSAVRTGEESVRAEPVEARPVHLAFAIPDHPWVDSADGAAVRIAMSVVAPDAGAGRLGTVTAERVGKGEGLEVELVERSGVIHADLTVGANVSAAQALRENDGISSPGFKLHGAGFIVTPEDAARLEADAPIKPYRNGKDLTNRPRGVTLIDLYGFDADEVRRRWPATYQWVLDRVKPERDAKAGTPDGAGYARLWWLHGKPRTELRKYLMGLPRYIATVETAKHRVFQFLDASIAPDNMLVCIALDDACFLGVLSSRAHVVWALAAGGRLGVGNDPRYNKTRCFETFPFPIVTPEQQARIRDLAEQLDAHRKRVLATHAGLTLTGLYNVLEKLKTGTSLSAKEKLTHELGLVGVLKQLHEELDAAVLDAYGWRDRPDEQTLLLRLLALNAERRAEEAQGTIRWLRPDFQAPQAAQTAIGLGPGGSGQRNEHFDGAPSPPAPARATQPPAAKPPTQAWPATLAEQLPTVARLLADLAAPQTDAQLAARFAGRGKSRLPAILAALAALGRARRLDDGRWMA